MEIWHTQGRKGSYIYRSEWMLQMPLIQLTQMCKIRMQMLCKVLQIKHRVLQYKIRLRVLQFKTQLRVHKSESGSGPCRSNTHSRSCNSNSSSRSCTGWSKYTCPATTTTGPYTTGSPCWYCSACSPDNLSKLDRQKTTILR